ncbi:MAG: hypothetical protein QOE42_585 [Chloroflexota bacterium]|nr:hypothetical protein [Chloroflexota bacterium]
MLVHSYYEEDPRVAREAEAIVAAGRDVDVFALRRPGTAASERIAGVQVERIDIQRHQGAGVATYVREYLAFLFASGYRLIRAHRRRRYGLVQVHTLPDFLVFAALPLRLVGVPVLLDLHEAMPEFFRVRFPGAANPLALRLLRFQERLSIGAATAAITVNDALAARLVGLGAPAAKIGVVTNSPALRRFDPAAHPVRSFASDGVVRLVYAGALSPTYELDVVLRAVARLAALRPDLPVELELYGRDFGEVPLADTAAALGVADRVRFHGRIPLDAVPAALAAADIGLAPTRRNDFTDYSLSTKVFEYGAMRKPVVASGLPLVRSTFPADTIATYSPGDADELAAAILRLVDDPTDRDARVERTAALVSGLGWERESERYLALVERLIGDALSSDSASPRAASEARATRSEPPNQEEL